jgi:HPt (histidine-containing phosphotransfer) domain-containing protein
MGRKTSTRSQTAKQKQPDPAVFDIGHLRRYTAGQVDLERELIGLFRQQLPQFLEQIENAALDADWRLATHSLKGSALTIGAASVGQIAEKLELLGRDGDAAEKRELIAGLHAAIAAFNAAVQQFYRE